MSETKFNLQEFFMKNKVFILGLLGSISLALQQFISEPAINWKVIGFSALMAGLSYIGNSWRGQGMTIFGVLGTLSYTFVTIQQTGNFNWNQFILSAIVAVITAAAPQPKAKEYEQTPTIKEAKQEAKTIKEEQKQN